MAFSWNSPLPRDYLDFCTSKEKALGARPVRGTYLCWHRPSTWGCLQKPPPVQWGTWRYGPKGKANTRISAVPFPLSCTDHIPAHAHVVYLLNAPCLPSGGTCLKHLKYSQLEIYSELGPLIFEVMWHWWWLFFSVELATGEQREMGDWQHCETGLLAHIWTRSIQVWPRSAQEMQRVLFLGIKMPLKDPQHFPPVARTGYRHSLAICGPWFDLRR